MDLPSGVCKIHWDATSHFIFVECCMEEARKGNKHGSQFNRIGWKNLIANFNARVEKNYNKVQLKSHWNAMKKNWKLWDRLMCIESGIGWDLIRKTIDATPQCWEDKIRANLELAKFRDKNLELYKRYYDPLFHDTIATGGRAMTPSEIPQPLENKSSLIDTIGGWDDDTGDSVARFDVEGSDDGGDDTPSNGIPFLDSSLRKRLRADLSSSLRGKEVKPSPDTLWKRQLDTMFQALSNGSNATFVAPQVDDLLHEEIERCTNILQGLPGIEVGSLFWYESCVLFWRKEIRIGFLTQPTQETKVQYMKHIAVKTKDLPPLPPPC